MKKLIPILAFLFCSQTLLFGKLTLEDCFKMARENYPLIKQFDLIEQSKTLNVVRVVIPARVNYARL